MVMKYLTNFCKVIAKIEDKLDIIPSLVEVCTYRLVMIGEELSKKFNPHVQTVTDGVDVIVT